MNRAHHFYCSREAWKRHVREDLVPAALEEVELGDDVLEVGPGFGPATDALVERAERLTALEIDPHLAAALRERLGSRVEVREGDGADLPFPDGSFSGAACFTMLHHVPTRALQDRLFAEVRRVVRPGATFAGTDSTRPRPGLRAAAHRRRAQRLDPEGCPAASRRQASNAREWTGTRTPCAFARRSLERQTQGLLGVEAHVPGSLARGAAAMGLGLPLTGLELPADRAGQTNRAGERGGHQRGQVIPAEGRGLLANVHI